MKTIYFYLLMAALSLFSIQAEACDPVAVDDDFELELTSDAIVVNVLLNDILNKDNVDSTTVRILSQPQFGEASVDAKTNSIIFMSEDNEGGTVNLSYEVCEFSADCGQSCSTANLELEVLSLPVVPEGLTLNGDGFNEGLRLTNIRGFNELELTIVNRWGHIVYRNLNYDNANPWRGTYGNSEELVEPGVYYYYLIPSRNGKQLGDVKTAALYIFR